MVGRRSEHPKRQRMLHPRSLDMLRPKNTNRYSRHKEEDPQLKVAPRDIKSVNHWLTSQMSIVPGIHSMMTSMKETTMDRMRVHILRAGTQNRRVRAQTYIFLHPRVMTLYRSNRTRIIFSNRKTWTKINMAGASKNILQKRFISARVSFTKASEDKRLHHMGQLTKSRRMCLIMLHHHYKKVFPQVVP